MDLLIIDEWLLTPIPEKNVYAIFEIIEARFKKTSTIFSSQKAPEGLHEQLGDALIVDAILDRIVRDSFKTLIDGEVSMGERHGLVYIKNHQ